MSTLSEIKAALTALSSPERAKASQWFFKTGKGDYGEGDHFMGVSIPNQRKVVKEFAKKVSLADISTLLKSPIHEHRMTALLLLVALYQSREKQNLDHQEIVSFYLEHLDYINNWDLVDSSASYILGRSLLTEDQSILFELAKPDPSHSPLEQLWRQRIAIIATLAFIKKNDFRSVIRLAELYLPHRHDLIHKATGWVLREMGKKDLPSLIRFLDLYAGIMPRTMLRYAIEKMPAEQRHHYLATKTRQSGK